MISHPSSTLLEAVRLRQEQLVPRIQHLPPAGSRPLTVAGRVAGWITPRATTAVAGMDGVHITDEAVHVVAAPRQRLPLEIIMRSEERRVGKECRARVARYH